MSVCHNTVVSGTMHGYKKEDCEGIDCGCLVVIAQGSEELFNLSNVPPSHVGLSLILFFISLCIFIDLVVNVEMKMSLNME